MAEGLENLILDLLRLMRSEANLMKDDLREMKLDIREIKQRVGAVQETCASLSRRFDRIGDDVHLIKRRLELADA